MKAVVYSGQGGVVTVQERPDPVAQGDEVVVAVRYAGLNQADVLQREGRYPPPLGAPESIPGLEVCGVVEHVGERVHTWVPGDRVYGLVAGGGLAQRVVVAASNLCRVPDGLDDRGAAAIPEAFITAHDALRSRADLAPGDLVAVSGASGGVGTAAVQIARAFGADVVGTSRTEAGRALVRSLGGVASAPADLAATIASAFPGRGVDVVIELVGAHNLPADLRVLATLGRIVVVGSGAGARAELDLRHLQSKRASVIGTVLRPRSVAEKAAAIERCAHEVHPHLSSGAIQPVIDRVFDLHDVEAALDYMGTASKQGKVLLDLRADR